MNPQSFPSDVKAFVRNAVAAGEYANEDALYVDAVRALRELKRQHQSLRRDVQSGIAELDAGQGEPWDVEGAKSALRDHSVSKPTG